MLLPFASSHLWWCHIPLPLMMSVPIASETLLPVTSNDICSHCICLHNHHSKFAIVEALFADGSLLWDDNLLPIGGGSAPCACKLPFLCIYLWGWTTFQPSQGKPGGKTWPSLEEFWEIKLWPLSRRAGIYQTKHGPDITINEICLCIEIALSNDVVREGCQ